MSDEENDPSTQEDLPAEYVTVGEAPIREAKRLQAALEARGVAVRLASDPEQCNSCSPKILMSVHRTSLAVFQAYLDEERARMYGRDASAEPSAASDAPLRVDAVFDPSMEEATCPACGTAFSTQLAECPDCGLGFALG